MKPVYTYKALSNTVFFFGFQPVDFGAGLIFLLLIWGITNSLKIALVWLCFSYVLGKKLKHRPSGSEKSFLIFIMTPNKMPVNNDDIPSYRSIKCQK